MSTCDVIAMSCSGPVQILRVPGLHVETQFVTTQASSPTRTSVESTSLYSNREVCGFFSRQISASHCRWQVEISTIMIPNRRQL